MQTDMIRFYLRSPVAPKTCRVTLIEVYN